ncbi:type III-A CRISPR-associated protein Csm2 [Nitrosomonas ureae]|uniref:CRISPR system Cms protein Csm2 n=1 Tax=Nitrosomonas ureae TaxID=44577 RepID=A0A2T5IUD8_9PROT|nr:type III-A CRISPR-associated protein Csm2 [Nitrosomonas ureae]PTQ87499.1 CRISPR-associated Csm2 family protein [Nitrosomonas ureae]PXX17117.1 CRISPR-associated Csm2 family protein [Nitrosomonas ureae]
MTENIESFIKRDDTAKEMVKFAEELAKDIVRDVSTSQIRNAYGTVKKLEMLSSFSDKSLRELLLLKPKLAYARGRSQRKETFKKLEDALGSAIDAVDVNQPETFKRFCNFFEAILAYHKANGGK